jgi:hypothetical protein
MSMDVPAGARVGVIVLLVLAAGCGHGGQVSIRREGTEGMWLPDALPKAELKKLYQFEPSDPWAENLRLSAIDIGASGSFVSPGGLILTNQHVADWALANVSTPEHDYVKNGFLAKSLKEEVRVPGMEISVLVSTQDVTGVIEAAIGRGTPGEGTLASRRAAVARLERESKETSGLDSHVVTLYGGAKYHLYRYRKYTDVRIVFAPEQDVAFFGGDDDNFEYPRYDLDITLLRAYEDGKPASVAHWLRLARKPLAEGDLVFVIGHPASTQRLQTVAQLEAQRDVTLPYHIEHDQRLERAALAYAARGQEQRRQAQEMIFNVQNALKERKAILAGLRQGRVMEQKRTDEDALRKLAAKSSSPAINLFAWDRVEQSQRELARLYVRIAMLEWGDGFESELFDSARTLVRLAEEDLKPDDQRLPEYTSARRESLEHGLFADEPVYDDFEIAMLTESLTYMREKLGADDPGVKLALAGKTPAGRAGELVRDCKLKDAAARRALKEAGIDGIRTSTDPMVIFARQIDAEARAVRKEFETKVGEVATQASADISRMRFAVYAGDDYPDATGTLRFAFGIVKGYPQDGQQIPPWTTIGGAFEHEQRHGATPPYRLSEKWHNAEAMLDKSTPLNFV